MCGGCGSVRCGQYAVRCGGCGSVDNAHIVSNLGQNEKDNS